MTSDTKPTTSFPLSEVDIWTVDQPMIWEVIRQRNALRQSAMLPLIDEQKEFDHACRVIRGARLSAFWDANKAEYDRMVRDAIAVCGPIRSWSHAGNVYREAQKRFNAYMYARFPDEIAAMKRIAPDYLAITRDTISGTANPHTTSTDDVLWPCIISER